MQKKIIILSIFFSIICFNLLTDYIQNNHSIVMAQNLCSSCPRLEKECKIEWNTVKKGICQSDQEWYYYNINAPNSEVWIEVRPEPGLDVDLYTTWNKACPKILSYDCVSNTGGSGQSEICHYIISIKQTPQFFMVNKISGSGCYDIFISSSQPTPTTIQSYITDSIKSDDNIGKSLFILIFFGIIVLTVIVIFLLRKKPVKKQH